MLPSATVMLGPAQETALLFPTGGNVWPGMGEDLDRPELFGPAIDRVEHLLARHGVPRGALRRLMAGEGQMKRAADETGWSWQGDFPLSMAAQTVVGACLGQAFVDEHGPPRVVAGESMGEWAAYAVAGALSLEQAALVAWRWAHALEAASRELGLRMAVIEALTEDEVDGVIAPHQGRIVVAETPTLFVVSLPLERLAELQRDVVARGATLLVSSNPCVAHDARLAACREIWNGYEVFVQELELGPTRLTLLGALHPGRRLRSPAELRRNLIATTTTRVRWGDLVRLLPRLGVRRLWQLAVPTRAYVLERLRGEDPALEGLAIRAVRSLQAIHRLSTHRPTKGSHA